MHWFVIIYFFLSGTETLAAGWTQPEDGYYFKVWNRSLVGSKVYTVEGEEAFHVPNYADHLLHFYGEYGLSTDLTLVAFGAPAGYAAIDGSATGYMGTHALGVRQALQKGVWNVALEYQLGGSPAVGNKVLFSGEHKAQSDGKLRPLIYQPAKENYYGEFQLQVGTSFSSNWTSLSLGYRENTNKDLDPVVQGVFQIGTSWSDRSRFSFDYIVYSPQGSIDVINIAGVGQTRYQGFNLSYAYPAFGDWSVNLGLGGVTSAESNAATPTLYFGAETSSQ